MNFSRFINILGGYTMNNAKRSPLKKAGRRSAQRKFIRSMNFFDFLWLLEPAELNARFPDLFTREEERRLNRFYTNQCWAALENDSGDKALLALLDKAARLL